MDGESFDAVAQRASAMASRRGVLRAGVGALAGVALGLVGLSSREDAAASKRRRKRCGNGGPCRVFVTSTEYGGSIGGLGGADTICQLIAEDPVSAAPTRRGFQIAPPHPVPASSNRPVRTGWSTARRSRRTGRV